MTMPKKPKTVNYELIPISLDSEPYRLLEDVRREWHDETIAAKVALAWRNHTNPDVDGRLVLGKCIRVTDLNKEFAGFDFIIVLNREVWMDLRFTREKKVALLDHEMCHAAAAFDEDGEPIRDERNRRVWRSRKHDIEEFRDVVARHGCYKKDLENFAEALLEKHANPLFDQLPAEVVSVSVVNGGQKPADDMPAAPRAEDVFSEEFVDEHGEVIPDPRANKAARPRRHKASVN